MQTSRKRIKQLVLERYVDNPLANPEDISVKLGVPFARINTIISQYRQEISLKAPLYITKSIDLPGIYYLFTESGEKKLEVNRNIIRDISHLTKYELCFLYNEKGFR